MRGSFTTGIECVRGATVVPIRNDFTSSYHVHRSARMHALEFPLRLPCNQSKPSFAEITVAVYEISSKLQQNLKLLPRAVDECTDLRSAQCGSDKRGDDSPAG